MNLRRNLLFRIVLPLLCLPVMAWADGKVLLQGVVPDARTKELILARAGAVFGADRIEDRITVSNVRAPSGWGDRVAQAIAPNLNAIGKGSVAFRSNWVDLTGKVDSAATRQQIEQGLQFVMGQGYSVKNGLLAEGNVQAAIDQTLANRTVEFEVGSAVLTERGKQLLDEIAPLLKQIGNKPVLVEGHTDNTGNASKNLMLSQQRADAVKQYLATMGLPPAQLTAQGFGDARPAADNGTAEGRQRNRRIAFRILGGA